jgi:ParB family chromosome partitioning protein
MARQPLGRGLSALLGDEKPPTQTESVAQAAPRPNAELDIDLIDPNPDQPRADFTEAELDELAASIRSNGVVQPIVVRPRGNRYQIVAGERRWRAAQRAELRRIPAVIRDVADEKLLELALIENIQRQELNPIEEANAYRRLLATTGLTQDELAARVGKERSLIATSLRLLRLPEDVQRLIIERKLSLSHGRALLLINDAETQRRLANEIVSKQLSVRDVERLAKAASRARRASTGGKETAPTVSDPNLRAAETKLMRHLSTNVRIVPARRGPGGKIELEYYGPDDLDRLYQMLLSAKPS